MKLESCRNCLNKVSFVTKVPQQPPQPNTLVLKCNSCDTIYHVDEPEGWIDNGHNYVHEKAREQGTSFVRDIKPEEAVKNTLRELQAVPADKIDEDYVRLVSAKIVLETMLSNCISKRPTVRQRAAEALAKITFKPAQTSVDVTSGGRALQLQALSTEELMAKTQGLVDRLAALKPSED